MRFVLIDYMHMAHLCIVAEPLSAVVKIKIGDNETIQTIDTTIPNYTIKSVVKHGGGFNALFNTGVFLEGGNSFRKNYFAQGGAVDAEGYKGGRGQGSNTFYQGIDLAINRMAKSGMSLYRKGGYEADDLVYSMIVYIKARGIKDPIDVITNDSDLLPLVDDQVSVYIRGTREFAEPGCPVRRLYYQVTPRSWVEYLSYTSAHKGFNIPYNSMLLFKLIRGDKADNVAGSCKGYGAKKYSSCMDKMIADGIDFPNIFRYGLDFDTVMRPVLINYFTEEEVNKMKFIYGGIGLRLFSEFTDIPKRIPTTKLQEQLSDLRINLPQGTGAYIQKEEPKIIVEQPVSQEALFAGLFGNMQGTVTTDSEDDTEYAN